MYELDKKKFGAFVGQLRREKGWTQRELAERLYISDKAVSKWETGASIPDTALLMPLAELLGVSVTELLRCERLGGGMDAGQVEDLVKTAISYAAQKPERAWRKSGRWPAVYTLCLLLGGICLVGSLLSGRLGTYSPVLYLLCAIFGAYFVFFVRLRLPAYYDENRISSFSDGPIRMNLAGVSINNVNWPHMVRAVRIWTCAAVVLCPALELLLSWLAPAFWQRSERYIFAAVALSLLAALYASAVKRERQD